MKNINNFKSAIIIAILFAFGLSFMGCEKEKNNNNRLTQKNTELPYFTHYGIAHNLFLSNVKDNFTGGTDIENIDECLMYISSFNKEFSRSTNLFKEEENILLIHYFDEFQSFYITQTLYDEVYNSSQLISQINFLCDKKCITESDKLLIMNLLDVCHKQYLGKLSIDDYSHCVKHLENEWYRHFNEKTVSEYSGIVLNIASYSAQWWLDNPEETKLAPWVASDAVGAAWGATVAGVTSYCQSGKVDWLGVGVAAASGAVTGSTGVVGKVGKWISKVIK